MKIQQIGTTDTIEIEGMVCFQPEPQPIIVQLRTVLLVIEHVADMTIMMSLHQGGVMMSIAKEVGPLMKILMSVNFESMQAVNVLGKELVMEVLLALEQVVVGDIASARLADEMTALRLHLEPIPEIVVV